jgi:hypothetical protein
MDEPLEIPDAAYVAGLRAAAATNPYDGAQCKRAIDKAARLIVAARLRHLIKDLVQDQESFTGGAEVDGLGIAIITLQLDVDQFDPHGLTA